MGKRTVPAGVVAKEFASAELGDARRTRRLVQIGEKLALGPAGSFPKIFRTDAEQEALYRLLRNPHVTLDKVLEPHVAATCARAAEHPVVLVLHDTTEFTFSGGEDRDGLYELRRGTFGFNAHASLIVSADGTRHTLGVAAMTVIDDASKHRDRWLKQMLAVDEKLQPGSAIHVADREADVYTLFAGAVAASARFVIRARHDRLLAEVDDQERSLLEQLDTMDDVATREVFISERRVTKKTAMPDERKARPPRNSRIAELAFRATTVTLTRPQRVDKTLPKQLTVNFVHVREVNAPNDAQPVDWLLATTEPITTREDILAIVDTYRARWTIEEYFKALKTGCAYEARQLESFETLTVALGIFAVVAWQVLLLRNYGRMDSVDARHVLTETQLKILRHMCAELRHQLPEKPTARDAMLGVARLGGHIKQNGDPGWQVLWRGFQDLIAAEQGYIIGRRLKM